jgi:hypothetical protein
VVGLFSGYFTWGKGECGTKSNSGSITGYQTMTPGTYTGFAKTVVGNTTTVDYTQNQFIVN